MVAERASVRGALSWIKDSLSAIATPTPRSTTSSGTATRLGKIQMGEVAVLNEKDLRQGMEEVLRLAELAGEAGSGEALVLAGDLHLVSMFDSDV